jgi:hypothetical protein
MKNLTQSKILRMAAVAIVGCGVISSAPAQNYVTTLQSLNPILYFPLNDANPIYGEVFTNLGTAGTWGEGIAAVPMVEQVPGALQSDPDTALQFYDNGNSVSGPSGHGGFFVVPLSPEMNPSYQDSWSTNSNPTAPFTVELWANPATHSIQSETGTDTGDISLVSFSSLGGAGNEGFDLYLNGSDGLAGWVWQMYNHNGGNTACQLTVNSTLVPGTWYHVAVVYDGTNAWLYTNGVLAANGPVTGFYPCVTARGMFVGARTDLNGGTQFLGSMDELAIYTNVLTAAQVLADYNAGTTASPPQSYTSLVSSRNPLLYYRLDDPALTGSGPTYAANLGSLGSANNGVISGGLISMPPIPALGIANNTSTLKIGSGMANQWDANNGSGVNLNLPNQGANNGTSGCIVQVPPYSAIVPDTYSIVCWFVDPTTNQGAVNHNGGVGGAGQDGFISCSPGGQDTGIDFHDPDGHSIQSFWAGNDGGQWSSDNEFIYAAGFNWNMIAVVWTATNTSVFLNGTNYSISTTHGTGSLNIGSGGWQFGSLDGFNTTVNVDMGQVAMFDYSLTASQILSLWQQAELLPQINSLAVSPGNAAFNGNTIVFSVGAYASGTISYQWQTNGVNIANATNSTYTIASAGAGNSANYTVILNTSYGSVTSAIVPLSVTAGPPSISQQPETTTPRYTGGDVTYSVTAEGTQPLAYQWFLNGVAIGGATNATYTATGLGTNATGDYTVRVTNILNFIFSVTNDLTVLQASNYDAAVMALNPFAYWPMNETSGTNTLDYAGGHDGAWDNGPLFFTLDGPDTSDGFNAWPAGTHNAYGFGGDAYIDCGLNTLDLSNNVAVAAWIRFDGDVQNYQSIVTKGDDTWRLQRNGQNDYIMWDCSNIQGQNDVDGFTNAFDGDWHFVISSYHEGEMTLFGDGQVITLQPRSTPEATGHSINMDSTYDVMIGNCAQSLGRQWSGWMANIALFTNGLTVAQMSALWSAATNATQSPIIEIQPVSQTVYAGQPATFNVLATGASALTYQWELNSNAILGATSESYTIASAANNGYYSCLVSNSFGKTNSVQATLTVDPVPTYADLTNGLVLHLKFDGNLTDSSGNGNNASAGGSPTFIAGHIGSGALHVNTSSGSSTYNYAYVPWNAMFTFTDFSVSYWVRMTGENNALPIIGNAAGSTYNGGWVMTEDLGQTEWSFVLPSNGNYNRIADPVTSSPVINDGNWHQIVVTLGTTSDTINTFVDGNWIDSEPLGDLGGLDTGNPLVIGQDPTGTYAANGNNVACDIDDIGVWNVALTPVEAESIYIAGENGQSFDTVVLPLNLHIALSGGDVVVTWTNGTLLSSGSLSGPWTPVGGASPPSYTVAPSSSPQFYRLMQ